MLLLALTILLLIVPQCNSFGTDAKPMDFETYPQPVVYISLAAPISATTLCLVLAKSR